MNVELVKASDMKKFAIRNDECFSTGNKGDKYGSLDKEYIGIYENYVENANSKYKREFYFVKLKDEIVGVTVSVYGDGICEIYGLAIKKEYRKHGIGKEVLRQQLKICRGGRNVDIAFLQTEEGFAKIYREDLDLKMFVMFIIISRIHRRGVNMIYITGDTYVDFSRFEEDKFPIQSDMIKNDYVIICGDFGKVWNYIVESMYEKQWLDLSNNKNFTTLFVDGNHENFERLYRYPVEEWHGGRVHKIRDSVIHLMRGEIYDINNKKFFVFSGARSYDIRDGILNIDEYEKYMNIEKRCLF